MKRSEPWPLLLAGTVLAGAAIGIAVALSGDGSTSAISSEPLAPGDFSDLDVEAAARMLASENPSGSEQLHVEQIWTQIRAKKKKESLFQRITAGSGWGKQGAKSGGGGKRPVSTAEPATEKFRELARKVLRGERPSQLPGARSFFEPGQQDKAVAIAERGRAKVAQGLPRTEQEIRLAGYYDNAEAIRARWEKRGQRLLGEIDGVQFYS